MNTKRIGRPPLSDSNQISKRDAVAWVAHYFETLGASPGKAIALAQEWLGVSISRQGAYSALRPYREGRCPGEEQARSNAERAYRAYRGDDAPPLPSSGSGWGAQWVAD